MKTALCVVRYEEGKRDKNQIYLLQGLRPVQRKGDIRLGSNKVWNVVEVCLLSREITSYAHNSLGIDLASYVIWSVRSSYNMTALPKRRGEPLPQGVAQ